MARRKELKNISQGLVNSFVSRNNDYDGYWELAKLYDLAIAYDGVEIEIDLLNGTIKPASPEFLPLITLWQKKLKNMIESGSISGSWARSVVIRSSFNVSYIADLHKWGAYGDPCTCVCEIITDKDMVYSSIAGTKCMPFSKAWFQRSTRRKNF
ncbi:hypothetical protein Q9247_16580 [Halomonas meridiana]|uniref:hypothetical protein n=1 Tax=Halomonadaceae TaxID=28256 RepID=UPI002556F741|nr:MULTISPECIES: hypothetical protein [Halomonas]MDK9686216.1 hypothetical protein [Halomonas sp. LC1]MDP4559289.1 hypothetical protein [Halomonas meridiana]